MVDGANGFGGLGTCAKGRVATVAVEGMTFHKREFFGNHVSIHTAVYTEFLGYY